MEIPSSPIFYIKNREALATTKLRTDALDIIEAGLSAVETQKVMREQVTRVGDTIFTGKKNILLSDFNRVFVVAIGKCAVDAGVVLDDVLGDAITDGIVLDVKKGQFKHLSSFVGAHPFSSEQNIYATKWIVDMLTGLTKQDLVFFVISGGGSALLSLPHKTTPEILEDVVKDLWRCGATIKEVNTVRKHLSDISGGQFAKLVYPATVISLIFSDVPGNNIETIASGPAVLDKTTKIDAEKILHKYWVCHNPKTRKLEFVETPKNKKYFANITNITVVSNDRALVAMKQKAQSLGYQTRIESNAIQGEAKKLGEEFAVKKMKAKSCLLYGGESTVAIKGDGEGGRNQELALGATKKIDNHRVVVAVSSDGWDNSDIAGAIADAGDRVRAEERGVSIDEHLEYNNSYNFWKRCGGGIEIGRTGINVADFYFILTE